MLRWFDADNPDFFKRAWKGMRGSTIGLVWLSAMAFGQNMEKPIDLTELNLEDLKCILPDFLGCFVGSPGPVFTGHRPD